MPDLEQFERGPALQSLDLGLPREVVITLALLPPRDRGSRASLAFRWRHDADPWRGLLPGICSAGEPDAAECAAALRLTTCRQHGGFSYGVHMGSMPKHD